ncbi:hypothetical protein PMG11_11368 [Penicillium brasilianum]|uniref:Uncharacterized protein n=1 Tax=Penicillium brasilianum TaxID=104259 RepID=A0A0F7U1X6_PENBI|nr:hypothetical protein PMG11_11368 [Penicillium brasilianum]
MLRCLGHADVHDIIFGSNVANVDTTDDQTFDVQKVRLAIRLADAKITEVLERFLPVVVVTVEPLCRTNWLRLSKLILQELRRYTKMFLEVEFHPVYQEDQAKQEGN